MKASGSAKKNKKFITTFQRKNKNKIKVPKFELEDIEDYYTYYVMILGISEDIFWNMDISFVFSVAANKAAYDSWVSYENSKLNERS